MRKKSQSYPREGRGGRSVPGAGGLVCRLSSAPRVAVYGSRGRTAKLRLPVSYLYSTWPQESLCPPDTKLEGTGGEDPNTLRADPGLPVLRPQNASATLTQRVRLPLGRCTGSSQAGLPRAGGPHGPPTNTWTLIPTGTQTRMAQVMLTQRC